MVHECRMQGAGIPSYYDRVPKLKQSMCGGIGRRLVGLESNEMVLDGTWPLLKKPSTIMLGANPNRLHKLENICIIMFIMI